MPIKPNQSCISHSLFICFHLLKSQTLESIFSESITIKWPFWQTTHPLSVYNLLQINYKLNIVGFKKEKGPLKGFLKLHNLLYKITTPDCQEGIFSFFSSDCPVCSPFLAGCSSAPPSVGTASAPSVGASAPSAATSA